ncbi:MAG: 4-hydroxy-tetrahydrodipicolinate synthase [Planctomycetota bacterium]
MFSGALTALVTPFRDGKVDEARLVEQVKFQLDHGIDGLVPVGTTGESPTLDMAEHKRVIELVVETAAGRVPVVAGAGGNSTAEALELHNHAKAVGATAALSVNPYYNKPTQEGLYRHFVKLADAIPLPIVLYNIPGRCGVNMTPDTVARLAEHEMIVAIKEATGSCDQASQIRQRCDLPILSGDDSLTLPLMSISGAGVISVASNVIPDRIAAMVKHAADGDFATARSIHHSVFPLCQALFLEGNPGGVKKALQLLGRDSGELRLPLWEVGAATAEAIAAELGGLELM